jgi:hypothetical protein
MPEDPMNTTTNPAAGTIDRRSAQALALFGEMVGIREMANRSADYLKAMDPDYLLRLIADRAAAAVAAHQADSRAEVDELGPEPAADQVDEQVDADALPDGYQRGPASGEMLNDDVAGEVSRHRAMREAMRMVYDADADEEGER